MMAGEHRRLRHPARVQPLRGRLGARDGHAVPVDEAGRLALGRHAQRHDRALAGRLPGEGRAPHPVPPRDRRRADRARGRRPAGADRRPRRRAAAARGREHGLRVRRRLGRRAARRRSTSRCSATAASTTRAGPRSRRHSTPWVMSHRPAGLRRRRLGALRHEHRLDAGAATSRPSIPTSSPSCSELFLEEARKYNVLPLDDRRVERFDAATAGRPTLIKGNSQLLFARHGPAQRELGAQHQEQVARGDGADRRPGGRRERRARSRRAAPSAAGRSTSTRAGRSTATPSSASCASTSRPTRRVPAGEHQVRMEFAYDGGGLAKGGTVTLFVDGEQRGRGPGRAHPADGLLGRRDGGRRQRDGHDRERRTTTPSRAGSPARSSGCRSTSARTRRTRTT